jgi:hypothetical protein
MAAVKRFAEDFKKTTKFEAGVFPAAMSTGIIVSVYRYVFMKDRRYIFVNHFR